MSHITIKIYMTFETGMKLFRAGDIAGSTEEFRQAVEQDENNHKAWNALGICLSKSGQYFEADTCFEKALKLDPGNTTYKKNRDKIKEKNHIPPSTYKPKEKKIVTLVMTKSEKDVVLKTIKIVCGILIGIFALCAIVMIIT